jgi:acyl CoA:acetate/3-ketoacid CoA transferase beta subunit
VYGQAWLVGELVFEQVFGGGAAANIADAHHQYIVKHEVCDLNRSLSR